MSSKGRKQTDAPPNENFPTEAWVVGALLDELPLPMANSRWLEPCAGEGAIIRAVHEWREAGRQFTEGPKWDCVEIRPEGADELSRLRVPDDFKICDVYTDDFLKWKPFVPREYDVVITNPPFSQAMEIIQKSFQMTDGHVIMLQRLNFMGSKKRAPFWWKYPADVYVLGMNRPSFRDDGKTDSIEYAWFSWPPGERQREHGKIKILRGGRP